MQITDFDSEIELRPEQETAIEKTKDKNFKAFFSQGEQIPTLIPNMLKILCGSLDIYYFV